MNSPNKTLRRIAAAMNEAVADGYEVGCSDGGLRLFAWREGMLHTVGMLSEDDANRWHVEGVADE